MASLVQSSSNIPLIGKVILNDVHQKFECHARCKLKQVGVTMGLPEIGLRNLDLSDEALQPVDTQCSKPWLAELRHLNMEASKKSS